MREASLKVLRDGRAAGQSTVPFFWAAFGAAGDLALTSSARVLVTFPFMRR